MQYYDADTSQDDASCCLSMTDCRHSGHVFSWMAQTVQKPLQHIGTQTYQRIKDFFLKNDMRYINPRFTYLLTYIPCCRLITRVKYYKNRRKNRQWASDYLRHICLIETEVTNEPLPERSNRRPPGRPRTTWMKTKTTQQDLESLKLYLNEAIDVAQNHPLWRLMSTFGATHS